MLCSKYISARSICYNSYHMNKMRARTLAVAGIMLVGLMAIFLFPAVGSALTPDPADPSASPPPQEVEVCQAGDPCDRFIDKYINPFITLLTISIGIIAAISFVIAAIQYSAAGDDPSAVQKAKKRMWGTVLGIGGYFFLFGFLNYLVPGGLL
jgi:hypothetical protein